MNVRIFEADSPRVRRLADRPRVRVCEAPERFAEPVLRPPSIPSNIHYDAKLWRFLETEAENGDFWWNVGR